VSIGLDDFFGHCNESEMNKLDLLSVGECIGNFFSPVVPNPSKIIEPITGDNLKKKVEAVDFISVWSKNSWDLEKMFTSFVNIPVMIIFSVIELVGSTIKYLLVFGVRFIFVYMFYVSIGFQGLMRVLTYNTKTLDSQQSIMYTCLLMSVSTILVLIYGGGWVNWS
jgi:hypothetical protein